MDTSDPAVSAARPATADFCVVVNAASGRRKEPSFEGTLSAALGRHPGQFAISSAEGGAELDAAIRRAVDGGHPVLVAAGGDGTITAVAEAAAAHGRALGIIPMGTFNFVARGLGIPETPDAAVDLLMERRERTVSVAEVNGRLFLNNASIGLYPAILKEREGIYRRWGRSRLAAYWSVVKTVFGAFRPLHLRVSVDGAVIRARTPLLFVARSAFQLEHYGLEGAEALRDDRFALFLAPDASSVRLLALALRLASGGLRAGRDIELVTGDEILVESTRRRLLVARDGERTHMSPPLRFRIHRDALRIIAPGPAA